MKNGREIERQRAKTQIPYVIMGIYGKRSGYLEKKIVE